MNSLDQLRANLRRIDGKPYGAYRDLAESYAFAGGTLYIDHVQRDPFAPPSKMRLRLPMSEADLPEELFDIKVRRVAMSDFLARSVRAALQTSGAGRRPAGSGKSGIIEIDAGRQEVLERTAIRLTPDFVEARIAVGLPANGRRIRGRAAEDLLCETLPELALDALRWSALEQDEARNFVHCVDNQEHLRAQLTDRDLVAFVSDGAVLPRESGACDRPLQHGAVPFTAPNSLRVELELLHPIVVNGEARRTVTGMGLRRGVTLIVGGGYHGKSTLLSALQRCVVPHIPGDGREGVVTLRDAVKIRAEDGRRVEGVDISPFIRNLPTGKSTRCFSSEDASGSTSQAANIVEALETGSRLLLLDEDTSATNFMIRDARMQSLISSEEEPITPFLHRVRELADSFDVSTILVMGGSGDYFDVADCAIRMRDYLPEDVTEEARTIAASSPTGTAHPDLPAIAEPAPRVPQASSFDASKGKREVKIDAKDLDQLFYGTELIDLRGWEQLLDRSQTRAIGHAIYLATQELMSEGRSLRDVLEEIEHLFDEEGLDALDPFRRGEKHPGNFARPRVQDVAAAINRYRRLRVESDS